MEYRDVIKRKETRQGRPGECDAVVQWMMATFFVCTKYVAIIHVQSM